SPQAKETVPTIVRLNIQGVVRAAHRLCRPAKISPDGLPQFVTLPDRVASLYLDMSGEWHLSPLVAITTAPILAEDGTIQTVNGYQSATGVYCCNLPKLNVPDRPTEGEAKSAVFNLRDHFKTFPFADAKRRREGGLDLVDLDQPMGYDESAFLCGLLTA